MHGAKRRGGRAPLTRGPARAGAAAGGAGGFSIPGPHSLAHREIAAWVRASEAEDEAARRDAPCPARGPTPPGRAGGWGAAAAGPSRRRRLA